MSGITRREWLELGVMGGAGLVLGARFAPAVAGPAPQPVPPVSEVTLHPLIKVATDGHVILYAQNPEMGQGVKTSLPMILAEELDVDFREVRVRQADWMPGVDLQFSGGSLSIRLNYQAMRQAGATARQMLLQAAARRWRVPVASLTTAGGNVLEIDGGRVAAYGELAGEAARLPVPEDVPLKDASEFRTIGRDHRNVDAEAIVTGRPLFGQDTVLPGMVYAVIRRCPVSDGEVAGHREAPALSVPGVQAVHVLSNAQHGGRIIRPNNPNFVSGVAVIADSTWAAMRGAAALEVEWRTPDQLEDTGALFERFRAALDGAAAEVRRDGDPGAILDEDPDVFEGEYRVPLLAHVPMEPMNCTARIDGGGVELWAPTQNPGDVAEAVSAALGVGTDRVKVHVVRAGGAFGRRYYSDFAVEAALLSREAGRPVKVVWTREDDVRHDYFRPAGVHRVRASADAGGRIKAWQHRLAGHSRGAFLQHDDPPWGSEIDPYTFPAGLVPDLLLEHVYVPSRIPLGQWRAVSASANVFVSGSAVDELAHRAGDDPLAFLLRLLGTRDTVPVTERFSLDTRRLRGVVRAAAEMAGWKPPHGWSDARGRHGRGIAAAYDQGAWVAQVAEVTVNGRRLSVDRIVAAVDCGRVINPRAAESQVQGAIMEGLSAALTGEITLRDGVVEQGNFHDYPFLRMAQAPAIEVHFAGGGEDPRGLGEPPLPVVAPAVCNAIFAATGRRIRSLPLKHHFS